jgi:hypothetical protein
MSLRIFIIALVLIVIGVTGCKSQKQKLEEEARAEATAFWESQVFSKCGGEYGNYFGRQGSKIYEFRSPIVIALSADEEKRQGVDWMGTTTVLSTGVRTFENGKWSDWQELKSVASRIDASGKRTYALVDDDGRWAIIGKDTGAGWSHVYFAPNEYHPVSCNEIEPLPK